MFREKLNPFCLPYRLVTGGGEQRRFEPGNTRSIIVKDVLIYKRLEVLHCSPLYIQEEGGKCQEEKTLPHMSRPKYFAKNEKSSFTRFM
jgi:hypothetical protein